MKVLFIDLDVAGLKIEGETKPQEVCVNWILTMIAAAEREKNPKGVSREGIRIISHISDLLDKAVSEERDQVEFQDDEYNFIRRCLNDARIDPQYAKVASRVLDCLERSEDYNKPPKEGG